MAKSNPNTNAVVLTLQETQALDAASDEDRERVDVHQEMALQSLKLICRVQNLAGRPR